MTTPTAQQARDHFLHFFSTLSEQNVRERIAETYSEDVHFNDTLKDIRGLKPLEEYLVESARAVESCTVELLDLAISGSNYYFRWEMKIRFKRFKKGITTPSIGMTHVKFNTDNKIAFQQDYWDAASGLFEHIPVVGYAIRRIKSRL